MAMASAAEVMDKVAGHTVLSDVIGRGGFATVFIGKHADGQRDIAVKRLSIEPRSEKSVDAEMKSFHKLKKHENVIELLGYHKCSPYLYIFMELCTHGDLSVYFKNYYDSLCSVEQQVPLMCQIANGLTFLHKNAVAHRDIKPKNILVTGNPAPSLCVIKITDFGLAKFLDPEKSSSMHSNVGTLTFKAPEFYDKGSDDTITYHKNVDLYAEGLVFWSMITAQRDCSLNPTIEGLEYSKYIGHEMYLRKKLDKDPLQLAPEESGDSELIRKIKVLIRDMVQLDDRPTSQEVSQRLEAMLASICGLVCSL